MNSHPLGGRRAFASPTHEPTERPRTSKNSGRTRAHMQALQASHALDCVHEQAKTRYLDLVSQLPASGLPSKVHECPHLDPVPHGTAMRRRLARTLLRACPETRAAAEQGSPPHKSDHCMLPLKQHHKQWPSECFFMGHEQNFMSTCPITKSLICATFNKHSTKDGKQHPSSC